MATTRTKTRVIIELDEATGAPRRIDVGYTLKLEDPDRSSRMFTREDMSGLDYGDLLTAEQRALDTFLTTVVDPIVDREDPL